MKAIVYTLSLCLFTSLFVQCGSNERSNENISNENTNTINAANLAETETYYVLSSSGLRMREEPSLTSKKLGVVEYGEKIQINPLDASKTINVNGIKGNMVKTFYKNDQGYMFTGYMSSIPVPERNQDIADYARQLKRKDFNGKFDAVEINDGMELEEILSIPAKTLEEAFLIGQRLNIFEIDFDLPSKSNPQSLKARANGKNLTLKLINPTTVGAVAGERDNAGGGASAGAQEEEEEEEVFIEGYQFNIPTNPGDLYWMKLIDLKFDDNDKLFEIMTQVAYEGGSWSCTLQQEGSFYVFRKNSIAD